MSRESISRSTGVAEAGGAGPAVSGNSGRTGGVRLRPPALPPGRARQPLHEVLGVRVVGAGGQRAPRASGELALHVLETMTVLLRSAAEGRRIELTTSVERPVPVPLTPPEKWR